MMQLVNLRAFAGVPESIGLPLSTDRPRLVILGTGWAAARVAMVRLPAFMRMRLHFQLSICM